MKLITALSAFVVFLGAMLVAVLLCSVPVWLLWNHVLTDVFPSINQIGLWQALGLLVLSSMLFKSYNTTSSK